MEDQGAVILQDSVDDASLADCKAAVEMVTNAVIQGMLLSHDGAASNNYDDGGPLSAAEQDAAFDKVRIDTKGLGIVRMAKIGAGKKNIHFCPYGASAAHEAMDRLAVSSGIRSVVQEYCGNECSLNETGISITRPGGGGLEWHADGREGECTVIMSLEDIDPELGTLGIILGSHLMLDRDTSEDFDEKILQVVARETKAKATYAYRSGQPICFDARTIHAAEGSKSTDRYRVILWWIYN